MRSIEYMLAKRMLEVVWPMRDVPCSKGRLFAGGPTSHGHRSLNRAASGRRVHEHSVDLKVIRVKAKAKQDALEIVLLWLREINQLLFPRHWPLP